MNIVSDKYFSQTMYQALWKRLYSHLSKDALGSGPYIKMEHELWSTLRDRITDLRNTNSKF